MRLMVMAAERAATMATTIQSSWRHVGQPYGGEARGQQRPGQARMAERTPMLELDHFEHGAETSAVSCGGYAHAFASFAEAEPVQRNISCLWQVHLREDAANILRHKVVDGFRRMIESGNRWHDDGSGLLRAQHVLQMNAVERRIADAEYELAIFLEHHIGGARHKVVAGACGDFGERAHRAGNHGHGVDWVTT